MVNEKGASYAGIPAPTKVFFYIMNNTFLDRFFNKNSNLKRHFLKDIQKHANFNWQKPGRNGSSMVNQWPVICSQFRSNLTST